MRSQIADGERAVADSVDAWATWLRGRRSLEELARLIQDHRLDAILTTQELRESAMKLAETVSGVYNNAAVRAADSLSLEWDTTNHWAAARMSSNSLRMVRELSDEQRDTIRQVLRDATAQGLSPLESARMMRGSIGLTKAQQTYVANYRQSLVDGSVRALDYELRDRRYDGPAGRGDMTDAQIDRAVSAYQGRLLDYRARTIARTESLRAVHMGTSDLWRKAVNDGSVDGDAVSRTWRTAHDTHVRDSHRGMDGQQRAIDEAFETDDGVELMYPGDPDAPIEETVQCRCAVVTRLAL